MSLGSSLEAKELVRQATDIVELVGKYVQLRRQGRNYVGLCPWHDDTRPSLQVNPERQSFKCWVCDIGGDVFSFVMKMDGVAFPEALAILADRAGIRLRRTREASDSTAGGPTDKRKLYQAAAWAERQYHECLLQDPEAEPARKYLAERGISASSIAQFRLGFSPNRWDWIQRRAAAAGFSLRTLEAVGLVVPSSGGGNPYDRFRGRLLFSIRDVQGRPVGLGGRVLPESGATSPAKYVNSPETPLFSKGNLLYGLDVARDPMRKARAALVMEGYTDCIMAHQCGFTHAVAVLGTALGSRHVQLLKRFADRIVLVLDGDEAGQRRTNEVLELFVAEKADLRILTLPEGLDPCDFLLRHGAAAFDDLLDRQAVDALEHAFGVHTRGLDLNADVDGVDRVVEQMLSVIVKAQPRLSEATTADYTPRVWKIVQRMAFLFRLDEKVLRKRLEQMRRGAPRPRSPARAPQTAPAPAPAKRPQKIGPCERELLELLIRSPASLSSVRASIRVEQIASGVCREIYETCCRVADAGEEPSFARLMLEFDDPAVKSLLVELDESGAAKQPADPKVLLEELAKSFQRAEASRRYPGTAGLLRESRLDEGEKLDLLKRLVEQERARHGISAPTDG